MRVGTTVILVLLVVPLLLLILEFFLCKKKSNLAFALPIVVACFFVFLGFYALIIALIMFIIYFAMKYIEKENQKKRSEIEKMNIQDLD